MPSLDMLATKSFLSIAIPVFVTLKMAHSTKNLQRTMEAGGDKRIEGFERETYDYHA